METRESVNFMVTAPGGASLGPSNFSSTHSPSSLGAGLAASLGPGAATSRARPAMSEVVMAVLRAVSWRGIRDGGGSVSRPGPAGGTADSVYYMTPDRRAHFISRESPMRRLALLL